MSLRRMADIARDAQNNAPRDPLAPAAATIMSSYTQALDTVRTRVLWSLDCMHANRLLLYTTLGPTRRDVPGYCRVVAEAKRGPDALKCIRVCGVEVCLVPLSVVR